MADLEKTINESLINEMIEDTEKLTQGLIAWADRWIKYGKILNTKMTRQQRLKVMKVLEEFGEACKKLEEDYDE